MTTFIHAKRTALAVASIAFFSGFSVQAIAQNTNTAQGSATKLAPVVVTATRSETRANRVISDVTVIDRSTIDQQTGQSLAQILARTPGIQITSNGGRGNSAGVLIRGGSNSQAILLVDGIRIGSATLGAPSWNNLDTGAIERIEILRGPASALYGSDAVTGAINIITRKGKKGQRFTPYAEAAIGTRDYRKVAGGFSGATGNNALQYNLHLQHEEENSQSSKNTRHPRFAAPYEADNDPYNRWSINGALRWNFNPKWYAELSAQHTNTDAEYDSDNVLTHANGESEVNIYGFTVSGQVTPIWNSTLRLSHSEDNSKNKRGTKDWSNGGVAIIANSHFNTKRKLYTWQNTINTVAGDIIAGIEKQDETVASTTNYAQKSREVESYFAGINGNSGMHSWQANWRHDNNSQFGNRDTYYLGYGIRPIENLFANISYGTSFKAPSFNQLYWPGFGNTNLKPQTGKNWELGVEYYVGNHTFSATYYRNKISQYLTRQGQQASNVDQAVMKGLELGYKADIGAWSGYANLDIMDNKDHSQQGKPKRRLNRTAKGLLKTGVDYNTGAWKAGTSILAVSNRLEHQYNKPSVKLGGYGLWDAYVAYQFTKKLALQLNLHNIGDKQYETAYGYNQPGRSAYLTLRYQGE